MLSPENCSDGDGKRSWNFYYLFLYFTVISEVLKAETVKSSVLWDVAPGSVLDIAGISEEHGTSIAKVDLSKYDSSRPLRSLEYAYKITRYHTTGCCSL